MKKLLAVGTVVALGFGGIGFALGSAAGARADHEAARGAPGATARTVSVPPATPSPTAASTSTPTTLSPAPSRPAPITRPSEPIEREVARESDRAPARPRVRRLIVTSGIEDREPADTIGTMGIDEHERVYAFVELANGGGAGEVIVTFERDGATPTGQVSLEVPARAGRWRTWAFTRGVRDAGEWRAVVRDVDGRLLAEEPFVVE